MLTSLQNTNLPFEESRYINELCLKLEAMVGKNLVGIYLLGSASQRSYVQGESDLDIQMVVSHELTEESKIEITQALRHDGFPCPATKLEFVTYTTDGLTSPDQLKYSINLNTGRTISDYISFDYTNDPRHWFLLDIAMADKHGINLIGEPFVSVFPKIDNGVLLDAMQECLNWFINYYPGEECYRCACRILYYLEQGELVSKRDGVGYIVSNKSFSAMAQESLIDLVMAKLKTQR